MQTNDSHVTTSLEYLESVEATRHHLADLYLQQAQHGGRSEGLRASIAEAHQVIGLGLKVAEVHAHLAVAQEVKALREALRPRMEVTLL